MVYDVKLLIQLLLPSMRNAPWMNLSLLEQTECSKFFCSPEMAPLVRKLQVEKAGLDVFEVPSLADLILGRTEYYSYKEVFEDARWNPILILHSSGSTGKAYRNPELRFKHLTYQARTSETCCDEPWLFCRHR